MSSRGGLWLIRLHGGTVGPELQGLLPRVLELGAHVGGDEVPVLDPLEAVPPKGRRVLSIQESTGNSASPEVDVATAFLTHRPLNRHVRQLNTTARAQHSKDPREDSM